MPSKLENGTDVIARWDRASERAGEEPSDYLERLKDLADSASERAAILVHEYGVAPSEDPDPASED